MRTVLVDGVIVYDNGKAPGLDVATAAGVLAEAQQRMIRDVGLYDYAKRTAEEISPLSLPMG